MSKYDLVVGFALLLLIGLSTANAEGDLLKQLKFELPQKQMLAPEFRLPLLKGGEAQLSDYKGKVVLINFWATWCIPCRDEMPSLQQLWKQYGGERFAVLGVAANRSNFTEVKDFVAKFNLDFPVLFDADGKVRNQYEVTGLPYTYLIGKDGKIIARIEGGLDWYSDKAKVLIGELL